MIKKEENRAKQLPIEKQYIKGVSLIDIDTTISEYMSTTKKMGILLKFHSYTETQNGGLLQEKMDI
jgi:hypothetical protein